MPPDTVMVVIGVLAMFASFAVTMFWANYQTRQDEPSVPAKRRPF